MQLQQELNTEKMAINRLGLPALAKINVRLGLLDVFALLCVHDVFGVSAISRKL